MTTGERWIRVTRLTDGRCLAYLVGFPDPQGVGAESSMASLDRGDDQGDDAVARLRRLYPDLPGDLPVRMEVWDEVAGNYTS